MAINMGKKPLLEAPPHAPQKDVIPWWLQRGSLHSCNFLVIIRRPLKDSCLPLLVQPRVSLKYAARIGEFNARKRLQGSFMRMESTAVRSMFKYIPFCYLGSQARYEMAKHLDVADDMHNWAYLAEVMKFDSQYIRWIKDGRTHPTGSCTLLFFEDCTNRQYTIEDLILSMKVVDNKPAFEALLRVLPDIERMFSESQIHYRDSSKRATMYPNSNVQPYEQTKLSKHVTVAPPFGEKQREELSRAALYSQQGSLTKPKQCASTPPPSTQLRHYSSAGPDIQKSPFTTGTRNIRVFVTYSSDNRVQLRQVVDLCACLRKNNFSVSLDEREKNLIAGEKLGWLDKRFRNADFILVLISPEYARDVANGEHVVVEPSDRRLNTRYIHKMMQNEYLTNGCINRRCIPLLMSHAKREHVPLWLHHTTIYSWPDDYDSLFFYMVQPIKVVNDFFSGQQLTPDVHVSRS